MAIYTLADLHLPSYNNMVIFYHYFLCWPAGAKDAAGEDGPQVGLEASGGPGRRLEGRRTWTVSVLFLEMHDAEMLG